MRPLARWTIGPVSEQGYQILRKSVKLFQKIYPEFDTIVCCNHIDDISFIKNINVEIYEQNNNELKYPLLEPETYYDSESDSTHFYSSSNYGMAASGWKLSPPRLRLNSHELWLDNDIIIRERIKSIDNWLKNDNLCIVSMGRGRNYGIYHFLIPDEIKMCAGFFGLPPYFDFNKKILDYTVLLQNNPLGSYDEQGVVAAILINHFHKNCVITDEIKIYEPPESLNTTIPKGFHFVCANKNEIHKAYNSYLQLNMI